MVSMAQEKKITNETLEEIRALPGVAVVIPRDYTYGEAVFHLDRVETWASILGVGVKDLSEMGLTAQVGSLALERGTVVVGAMTSGNFYDPRQRPGQLRREMGRALGALHVRRRLERPGGSTPHGLAA